MRENELKVYRLSSGRGQFKPSPAGELMIAFVYQPELRFSLGLTKTGQPDMKTLRCTNASVSAQAGLSSDIFYAAKEFLLNEHRAKVDRSK